MQIQPEPADSRGERPFRRARLAIDDLTSRRKPAPGPRAPFGLPNLLGMMRDALGLLGRLKERHGDVAEMRLFGKPYFLISHPDDIETILVKNQRLVGRDEYVEILERTLGLGLLTSDGDLWKRQRKLMAQAFTPRRIRQYSKPMVEKTLEALDWRDGDTINIHHEMSRITMEVVAEILFGKGMERSEVELVRRAMETANEFYANSPEAVLKLPTWVPTPRNRRMNAAIEAIDGLIYRIIADRRQSRESEGDRDDLLETLLSAQDEGGIGMSDQQLRDEAVTLFLAGHETTALALAHTLYAISRYPDVERRLLAELDEVLGGRAPTAEDVKKLVYTERVVKESMRLYPPAWTTGREALAPMEVGGYTIPEGAQIMTSQWVVHRDPRFFPDPEAFDPERWAPERAKKLPRYAYFPFGGGPRICIGNHFAMMEATLILVLVMQRYHLELLPGQQLSFNPSVTLRQKGPGLSMRAMARDGVRG